MSAQNCGYGLVQYLTYQPDESEPGEYLSTQTHIGGFVSYDEFFVQVMNPDIGLTHSIPIDDVELLVTAEDKNAFESAALDVEIRQVMERANER